ncbi:hypothetical protein AB0G73_09550 [Streptomyces sp. NPDC020719]|uniref:hypothetical protein n=1 Tax=Streptomyces sp. NPDC020719 TaxID=3154896 RepID=UPI0033F3C5B0
MRISSQAKRSLTGVLGVTAVAAALLTAPGIASADTTPKSSSSSAPSGHSARDNRPAATLVSNRAFGATSFTQTNCYTGVNDGQVITWYGAPVSAGQPVTASASEAGAGLPSQEFVGDAHVYSESVTVVNSAILVRVHTGWGAPLGICLHFTG